MTKQELSQIDVSQLAPALTGACFHGEIWVRCPYCTAGNEISNVTDHKNGYYIIKCCSCHQYFKQS